MKHIYKYIIASSILCVTSISLAAQGGQTYHSDNGVSTAKSVSSQNPDGTYTITLETFATGAQTIVKKGRPVDIVLVLDVSGSMSNDNSYIYSATERRTWTSQNVGSATYYYKDNDDYYQVVAYNGQLFYYKNGWRGIGASYTGVLYTRMTKLAKMKEAVGTFIDIIKTNNDGLNLDPGVTGNQISIVKFAGTNEDDFYPNETSLSEGNHKHFGQYTWTPEDAQYYGYSFSATNSHNYTEVVKGFTLVNTDGSGVLKTAVNALEGGGGTMANNGMTKARHLMAWLDNPQGGNLPAFDGKGVALRTRTVVLFTDGNPGLTGYDDGVADEVVEEAYALKHTYHSTVFTVGVFGSDKNTKTDAYMNSASSNEPDAQSVGTDNTPHDYYQSASDDLDLEDIFAGIAEASGGENEALGTSTEVRDVVSNSFKLPFDTTGKTEEQIQAWAAENIKVYVVPINENGESWAKENDNLGEADEFAGANISIDGSKVSVTGFEYGATDNWVGRRLIPGHSGDSDSDFIWKGKKLVIKFKINAKEDATGGDGTATNTSESGVYDADGNLLNKYEEPHTNLPVNIIIKKSGLRHGESATFEIYRIRPKKDSDGKIVYNAIGKPQPNESTEPGDDEQYGWEDWTKVIVTNKGDDGAVVTKTLVSLDPSWIYKVEEDNWGWAYDLEAATQGTLNTSTVEVNPFEFNNKEKTGVVKHAEAVSINHFATSSTGTSTTEDYSSSKKDFRKP